MAFIEISVLQSIAGGKPDQSNMRSVLVSLDRYGRQEGLDKPHRFAHFICQLMHENVRFRYDSEIWGPTAAQRRYEDRADLGHSAAVPNEAFNFRGRSGIQLTGRYNYQQFTKWAKSIDRNAPNFEKTPDLVNTDPWEGLAPIWYWSRGNPTGKSLNVYADSNNIEAITRKINGGLNGYSDRVRLYTRSALVLMGYTMAKGVVLRFQKDLGFKGNDLDDIAGAKTRQAMHEILVSMPALGIEEPDEPPVEPEEPVIDLTADIEETRALIQQADRKLASMMEK